MSQQDKERLVRELTELFLMGAPSEALGALAERIITEAMTTSN
ncbi:hypothetical protein [uncultured Limnobacter sp.]